MHDGPPLDGEDQDKPPSPKQDQHKEEGTVEFVEKDENTAELRKGSPRESFTDCVAPGGVTDVAGEGVSVQEFCKALARMRIFPAFAKKLNGSIPQKVKIVSPAARRSWQAKLEEDGIMFSLRRVGSQNNKPLSPRRDRHEEELTVECVERDGVLRPCLKIFLKKSHLLNICLNIPTKFLRHHVEACKDTVWLQVADQSWSVRLCWYKNPPGKPSEGWLAFIKGQQTLTRGCLHL
ncbi:hypothetical protein CDL15_Pgr013523 [Punica granatum]|uniref:TF-B3 domain-containing protein n=1 Tax=Punica granatum TaxID=22663 RepID=A0A218W0X8_PUNGR|nr:hypothetical protein CDL15_Pgr013523 [Punica granatum]